MKTPSSVFNDLSRWLEACGCSFSGEEVGRLIDQALDHHESPQVLVSAILDRCSAFDEYNGELLFQSVFALWNDKAREWNRARRFN
ncbi:MAG: hypothetical protein KIT79_08470 [Deltaproteobacteria bacterium]|nr:hypothetical protein [Deltaproteobacteria bacterium]